MNIARRARHKTWSIALACALASVCLAAVLGASAALGQDETTAPAAGGKVVLKIGWMGEVDNLNPFIGWSNNVYEVYACEYLLMVGRNWDTGKPDGKSGVAKSWEVSDDGLVWTFHVNEGMTWQDGQPVTAKDAAFTYNYIIENEISAFITFLTGVDRAEVVDDYTYKVICKTPVANMLDLWFVCLPEHIWGKMTAKEATVKFQNDPPCIGNGPWRVTEWKRNDYLRMTAYKDWYLGAPTVDEVYFVLYQNGDTMVQDFLSGNVDAIYMFPPAQYDKVKNTEGVEARKYTFKNWDYVGFNCYKGPSGGHPALRDQRFRSALEYAIDRQKIVDNAYSGNAIPGYTFLPPNSWSNPDYAWAPEESQARTYDPDMANQILDDAGYTDSNGDGVREYEGKNIKLRLWADTATPEAARTCKLIAGWWRAVGIDVAFSVQNEGVYFDNIWGYQGNTFNPDFDAYYWEWDGYGDPGQSLTCFTTPQIEGWNEFSWANARYTELDQLQAIEMDPDQRAEYIHQMQEVMYEDCPCIVTVHPYKLQAYRTDRWDGWRLTGGPDGKYGQQQAFMTTDSPWEFFYLTPKVAEENQSDLGLWVAIIVAIVVVVGIVVWLIVRSRRGGPAIEE
jgi:peptide/nickel transport system substrate-binding protein